MLAPQLKHFKKKSTYLALGVTQTIMLSWVALAEIELPQQLNARPRSPSLNCPRMGLRRYSILSATKYWPLVSGCVSSGARQNLHPAPYLHKFIAHLSKAKNALNAGVTHPNFFRSRVISDARSVENRCHSLILVGLYVFDS